MHMYSGRNLENTLGSEFIKWVHEFAGVERWNGILEWSTGLDYWSGGAA